MPNTEINNMAVVDIDIQSTKPISKGRFISLEGTEGVGKTTVIKSLCSRLDAANISYIKTREPGGSPFAETLRDILLDVKTEITDDTELLLLFAGRCDHIQNTIMPALERGEWVICDRFFDSTIAYQGFGRGDADGVTLTKIETLIEQFIHIEPELTLWLDMPLLEGMLRADKRSALDRFEQQATDFFTRVYSGFEYQAVRNSHRIERISALGSENEVAERVWSAIQGRFSL